MNPIHPAKTFDVQISPDFFRCPLFFSHEATRSVLEPGLLGPGKIAVAILGVRAIRNI